MFHSNSVPAANERSKSETTERFSIVSPLRVHCLCNALLSFRRRRIVYSLITAPPFLSGESQATLILPALGKQSGCPMPSLLHGES